MKVNNDTWELGRTLCVPPPVLRNIDDEDTAAQWADLKAPELVHVITDLDGAATCTRAELLTAETPHTVYAEVTANVDGDPADDAPAVLEIQLTPGNGWVNVPMALLTNGVPKLRTRRVKVNDLLRLVTSDDLDAWVHQAVARTKLPLPSGALAKLADAVHNVVDALGMRREALDDAVREAEKNDRIAVNGTMRQAAERDKRMLDRYATALAAAIAERNGLDKQACIDLSTRVRTAATDMTADKLLKTVASEAKMVKAFKLNGGEG